MKKAIYLSLALFMFLLAAAQNSFACSCVASVDPVKKQIETAFTGSDAVFSGEVLEIKASPTEAGNVLVKIRVAGVWKGASDREITVTTPRESAMCGYGFEVGKQYLVYANGPKDKLSVYNCSRTAQTGGAKGDIKYLAKLKGRKPGRNK